MKGYPTLSFGQRLVAMVFAALACTLVITAALLPFGLDSPQRGEAIVARESALREVRTGAAAASAVDATTPLREARSAIEVNVP